MKLNVAGTVNRLNVEHRTSNIERPILMALRFIDFKTSESQTATTSLRHELRPNIVCRRQSSRISKSRFAPGLRSCFGGVDLLSVF
jgi:hypothetical protein